MRLNDLSLAERTTTTNGRGGDRALAAAMSERPKLGEILLAAGEISEADLRDALQRKSRTGRRIGEELVAAGRLSADRLARALGLQRRLVLAALFTALAGHANAADVRAYMRVSATVVDTVGIRAVYQAQNLVVTAQDVERGYVEVPAASRFEIRNQGPCLFEFRTVGELFRSVRITAPGGSAEFGAVGGSMLQMAHARTRASVDVSYRFELAAGVTAGTYRWPIALTILPM